MQTVFLHAHGCRQGGRHLVCLPGAELRPANGDGDVKSSRHRHPVCHSRASSRPSCFGQEMDGVGTVIHFVKGPRMGPGRSRTPHRRTVVLAHR